MTKQRRETNGVASLVIDGDRIYHDDSFGSVDDHMMIDAFVSIDRDGLDLDYGFLPIPR